MFSSGKFSSGKKKHNPIFGVGADDADGADGQGLAYSRFGPLEGLTSETADPKDTTFNAKTQRSLRSKAWYRPDITRKEMHDMLETQPTGMFMVQPSASKPGNYALAISVRSVIDSQKRSVWRGLICKEFVAEEGAYRFFINAPDAPRFKALVELINEYRTRDLGELAKGTVKGQLSGITLKGLDQTITSAVSETTDSLDLDSGPPSRATSSFCNEYGDSDDDGGSDADPGLDYARHSRRRSGGSNGSAGMFGFARGGGASARGASTRSGDYGFGGSAGAGDDGPASAGAAGNAKMRSPSVMWAETDEEMSRGMARRMIDKGFLDPYGPAVGSVYAAMNRVCTHFPEVPRERVKELLDMAAATPVSEDDLRDDELWTIEKLLLETKGSVSTELKQLRKANEAQAKKLRNAAKRASALAKDAALHKSAADVEKMERDNAARKAAEENARATQLKVSMEEQAVVTEMYIKDAEKANSRATQYQSKMDALQESLEQRGIDVPIYPSYWAHHDISKTHIGTVDNTRFMGPKLQKLMRSTNLHSGPCGNRAAAYSASNMNQLVVTKVLRVENTVLWKDYHRRKQAFQEFNDSVSKGSLRGQKRIKVQPPPHGHGDMVIDVDTNEFWLFHGTSWATSKIIAKAGFDERVGKMSGLYGSGVYFAENPCKSNQYNAVGTTPIGERIIVYSRVLLGDVYETSTGLPGIRRAPNKPRISEPHDSVIAFGGTQVHKEYIVYNSTQSYPEFIVYYTV